MASDPLVVLDMRQMGDAGKRVQVECREPSSCLSVGLYGQSVAVNAAVEALERIHQSAHALREVGTTKPSRWLSPPPYPERSDP